MDFFCIVGGGVIIMDCWKKDFGGGEGGGGFWKFSICVNIFGDGGVGGLVLFFIGDGEGWNLGGVLLRGFMFMCDYWMESSGMK